MATISNNDIARAVYLASKESKGAEQSVMLKNVVNFLSKRRLLSRSEDILQKLENIINKEEGRMKVRASSAVKLEEKNKMLILHSLKHRYGVKDIVLEEKVKSDLLGGVKLEMGDEVIDLTIRNRMNKLQAHLNKD